MHVTDIRERINWINGNKNEMNFSSEIKLVNILKKKKTAGKLLGKSPLAGGELI